MKRRLRFTGLEGSLESHLRGGEESVTRRNEGDEHSLSLLFSTLSELQVAKRKPYWALFSSSQLGRVFVGLDPSQATEWVKGRQMEEVVTIKNTEIAKHLSLPPVKLHCSMLAEDAIKAAVKDYEAKHAKSGASSEAAPAEKAANA
ncbi:unnamed protein product [Camellia sinensis]